VDRSHRLSNLLLAIHPLAQFLSSVLMNNIDLIFITVVVRHVFSPQLLSGAKMVDIPDGFPQLFQAPILLGTVESRGPAHQDR
jgi:hypothetical protein